MQFTTVTYNYLKIMEALFTKIQYIMVYDIFIISIYFFYRGHFQATNLFITACHEYAYCPMLNINSAVICSLD
jgi:hypothetical protein